METEREIKRMNTFNFWSESLQGSTLKLCSRVAKKGELSDCKILFFILTQEAYPQRSS